MITIVRDRIQDMVNKGMTLQQVKAAGPAKDYDPLYSSKELTTDAFVETIYTDLSRTSRIPSPWISTRICRAAW